MKKQILGSRKAAAAKRARKGARKCPCCGCAPCACEKTCFCQELKGEVEDEEEDEASPEVDLQFSFLRHEGPSA